MVTLDAVPHTVPGTYAGRVSRRSWRSSTRCMPIRRRRCGVSPAVRVRGLSPPGADLQLLRPGADLLRWRLCAACSPPQPAGRWTALPNQPSWGRLAHAVRARRYRARRKKVTHHGSPLPPSDDLLASGSPMIASEAKVSTDRPSPSARDFCVVVFVVGALCDTIRRDTTMVTPPDIEAQILRFYHAEKWTIGTIARQLHIHNGVVRRVLAQAGVPKIGRPPRKSLVDAYLPFIRQTLETFPTLTASRLHGMVRERGYQGGRDHFRHLISCHRPHRKVEAYLRLRCLPGEQGQVDWAHFGHLEIGRARRSLMAFVMVLSHSRQIFLRFFPDARMENFLRGHVAAFNAWGGVPRVLLYDNLKSAVLERRGDATLPSYVTALCRKLSVRAAPRGGRSRQ
jgi:transposase